MRKCGETLGRGSWPCPIRRRSRSTIWRCVDRPAHRRWSPTGNLNYAELDEQVGRIAAALVAAGLEPGDRVASWMGKTRLACLLPLAAARAGLVHVPINPVLRAPRRRISSPTAGRRC